MRSAARFLGVLILVAGAATAADEEKKGAPTPPPSPAGPATTAMPDLDRFLSLHARIEALEKKLPPLENKRTELDPTVEQAMWTAFWALGMALTIAWVVSKFVENVDSERQARVAMWKELVQAAKVPAKTNADPRTALNEFATGLEAVGGQLRLLTGLAEQVLREADARLQAAASAAAALEKKIQAAAQRAAPNE